MTESVRDRLLGLICEITGRDVKGVEGNGDLTNVYGMDSIQSVRLISHIEKTFGLVFGRDPDDMRALASIDSLSRWVEERE
jgi:acyl carrier protein